MDRLSKEDWGSLQPLLERLAATVNRVLGEDPDIDKVLTEIKGSYNLALVVEISFLVGKKGHHLSKRAQREERIKAAANIKPLVRDGQVVEGTFDLEKDDKFLKQFKITLD